MSSFIARRNFSLCIALVVAAQLVAHAIHAQSSTPSAIQIFTVHKTVQVTGLTPGGAAAVVTSWRIDLGGQLLQNRTWRNARADQSGTISVEFGYPVPAAALVAVIDVSAGRMRVARPDGSDYPRMELPQRFFRRNDRGEVDDLLSPQEDVLVVVLRPGDGAWLQIAGDGGSGDADGATDGRIMTNPGNMKPIAFSGPAPKKIKPRDLVLAIDIDSKVYASAEVAP